MSSHNEHAHAADPKAETRVYIATLVALLILTGITVAAAGVQFGSSTANIVIALTIATIKASIVSLYFMHLRHDKPVNAIIAVAGYVFLGLLLLFTFLDVGSRTDPLPTNVKPPVQVAPAEGGAAAQPAAAEGRKE